MSSLADRVDAVLPQTQCRRCGYPSCRAYAEALARNESDINRCPPGGEATVGRLASLLGRERRPLDPACGAPSAPRTALVDEPRCIGCTLCIQACPVDAIVGGTGHMHTVLSALCTGCALCLPPCPVDCIDLVPAQEAWDRSRADAARQRFVARTARLARERSAGTRRGAGTGAPPAEAWPRSRKRAVVEAAVARARARKIPGA